MQPTIVHNNACRFTVWAPEKEKMVLHLVTRHDGRADGRMIQMKKDEDGYFHCTVDDVGQGHRYYYRPDNVKDCQDPGSHDQPEGKDYPDPASYYQPLGIHG